MSSIDSAQRDGQEAAPETNLPPVFPFPDNPEKIPDGFHEHLLTMCADAGKDSIYQMSQRRPAWGAYMIFTWDRELRQFENKLQNTPSTDPEFAELREKYFSKFAARLQVECNMVMLEKGRRTPRSEAVQNFLGWLQSDTRSHTSATNAADLSHYNHSVPLHNLEPQQVWARAVVTWAMKRDSGSWVEKLFKGKTRDVEHIGEVKEVPAEWPERLISIMCDMVLVIWFCVPVGVLGSGVVSQGVGIVLFIFFVLSAAVFTRYWYPELQHGIVITVGYGALLSAIIFR